MYPIHHIPGPTNTQKFEEFHRQNPAVYQVLRDLSRQWRSEYPDQHCGIAMLFEVARWRLIHHTGDPEYLLNNNHKAFYARLLMLEPGLEDLFELRDSEADAWIAQKIAERDQQRDAG